MDVPADSTSVTTYFAMRLSSTGGAATGLDVTTMDLTYVRSGAAPAAKVDATALGSTGAAWAANKAIEVDAVNQEGLYRVDWPDAAFVSGAREVICTVKCPTCFTEHLRVALTSKALDRAVRCIGIGTVGVGSSVSSIITSTLTPVASVTDQFKGRIVIFDKDTTTAALRGQATDITSSSTAGVLTVTALTTPPQNGDSFCIQ